MAIIDPGRWDSDASYRDGVDAVIAAIAHGMPESWDGDDSPEHVVFAYVREIERRLIALGGSLERGAEETPLAAEGWRPTEGEAP
jgi:hypothetical protein